MIPILYDSKETQFLNRGIGSLSDAQKCTVQEERNGAYELFMVYPLSGIHYKDIQLRSIIVAKPNPKDVPQPFRVYRISKPMNGRVSIYAQHISYDLGGIGLSPFTAASAQEALVAIKSNSIGTNPFTFGTDKATQSTMTLKTPSTVRTVLGGIQGSIIDVYGGEWKFDRYSAYLYDQRGANTGVTVRYGKNLVDLKQEENCSEVCTSVYPYWTDGTDVVTLQEKLLEVPNSPTDYQKVSPLDLSERFESKPTEDELRAAAVSYVENNSLGIPKVSLKISFIDLSKTAEYKEIASLESIALCDTVTVFFEKLGVKTTAKVTEYEYDTLLEKYIEVSLGDKRGSIADTVVSQQVLIEESPTRMEITRAADSATSWITGSKGGYVRFTRNEDGTPKEILVMDTPDIETATKVWRWNQGGLGYSNKGYNGKYNLALTQDGGIVADFISTGILNAITIQSADGKSVWNLNTGSMSLFNTVISTEATGHTYSNADYTQADVTRAGKLSVGAIQPTLLDYEKLDIFSNDGTGTLGGDGKFTVSDTVQLGFIVNGTKQVNFTTHWHLKLDPTNGDEVIKVYRVTHDNLTNTEKETVVFSAGFTRVLVNSIAGYFGDFSDTVTAKTVDAKSYKLDGKLISFPEQTVIGYVVYAVGRTTARSSCFIPYGTFGRFQCASDDWYCSFTFDGYGSYSDVEGTGSIQSVTPIYNF